MIQSMTAYASRTGARGAQSWTWEMRGINGRGLDLRLRLPDGIEGLEPAVRAALTARLSRGNVSLTLKMLRDEGAAAFEVDPRALAAALAALQAVQAAAAAGGIALNPASAAEVLALRGVIVQSAPDVENQDSLFNALMADLEVLSEEFIAMRKAEGRALQAVLLDHLAEIERLTADAARIAEARRDETRAGMAAALRRVFEDVPEMDEGRIAQELALIAVKSDVTEEINRLTAHVAAARGLLDDARPSGRKLDFLAQEFNREANTLCSKAQCSDLTRVGLDLKSVIDQMREQIQNVE